MRIEQDNPMHPDGVIKRVCPQPFHVGAIQFANGLLVSESLVNRILNGKGDTTPTMALKLSKFLGRSPESWLSMRGGCDLRQARQNINLDNFETLEVA